MFCKSHCNLSPKSSEKKDLSQVSDNIMATIRGYFMNLHPYTPLPTYSLCFLIVSVSCPFSVAVEVVGSVFLLNLAALSFVWTFFFALKFSESFPFLEAVVVAVPVFLWVLFWHT